MQFYVYQPDRDGSKRVSVRQDWEMKTNTVKPIIFVSEEWEKCKMKL